MSAIQRVLFPIDLSLNYPALTASTRRMFDRPNVEIIMLHAIEEPANDFRGVEVVRAMTQMEFLARRQFDVARVCRRVQRGPAGDCILEYAWRNEVDVILMPAGGPDSLRRNSVGHVAEEVLSGASCDVWMERMTGAVECVRHICCAIRLDQNDAAVLSRAVEVADDLGAELTILHAVVPDGPMALWWEGDAFQEIRIARMRVDELREKFAPRARLHVEGGHLGALVSRALFRLDAGLLISAGKGEALVATAMACPVLQVATPESARDSRHHEPVLTGAA
jgi:nucleotide-binding universal stress UspA family protein